MKEYDNLTGVLTREAFCERAQKLVKENPDTTYDIVLSDFVNFKHFNERFGTDIGDLLLIRTGQMLSTVAADTICGRYGADRFVSLVPHLTEQALGFLSGFKLPDQAKEELPVSSIVVKFGVCANLEPDTPISVYCDHAYSAVQSVKHQYGRNVAVYDDVLGEEIRREVLIEENMKHALEEEQFVVYYQPKMNLESGTLCGAEALVRWVHPTYGFMSPDVFIPLFERNGFITEMDFFVWESVCKSIRKWCDKGMNVVPISVNISRIDFSLNDLKERIIALVDQYGIDRKLLHLEVTESGYAEKPETMVRIVDALHEAGFVIELDDFGAGFTSLSSLNDLKLDILKCDMSILRKDDPESERSVLAFATKLANMMNLEMIQEGVETKEEAERLKKLGCSYIQGYYYSKPLSKEEFERFCAKEGGIWNTGSEH